MVTCGTLCATAAPSRASIPSTAVVIFGLQGTPVAHSELTPVVRGAQVNMNAGGTTLAHAYEMTPAVGSVEIDVSGPNTVDGVLFFVYGSDRNLGIDLALEYAFMQVAHNATKLGTIVGYPASSGGLDRSLVWNQPGTNTFGAPTAATFAGIVLQGDVSNLNTGAPGGVIVEGVAINSGRTPPLPATAIALAKWGVAHLARVIRTAP